MVAGIRSTLSLANDSSLFYAFTFPLIIPMKFQFGIEHEVAFLRPDSSFADFSNTTYEEFSQMIDLLPEYDGDGDSLRFGDVGIRRKRWYIEGIERFDAQGRMVKCIPKGIEIRTKLNQVVSSELFGVHLYRSLHLERKSLDTSMSVRDSRGSSDHPLSPK